MSLREDIITDLIIGLGLAVVPTYLVVRNHKPDEPETDSLSKFSETQGNILEEEKQQIN
jgi:hypothetical protein